jgi:hypothetical protein
MNTLRRFALLAVACAAFGCAPPVVMITNSALGDKVVRFAIQRNPTAAGTFNLLMQACGVDQNGQPANCRGAMVLERVNPRTLY